LGQAAQWQCIGRMRVQHPDIQLPLYSPDPRRPLPDIVPLNVEYHSTTTAALNTDIETPTVLKDIVTAAPSKGVLQSVIAILTLAGVRLSTVSLSSYLLIGDASRTR